MSTTTSTSTPDPAAAGASRNRGRRRLVGGAVAFAAVASAAAGAGFVLAGGDSEGDLTGPQRTVIRDATKQFKDPAAAIEAGFVPTDACVAHPELGGMGYHYVNPAAISDTNIDPTLPEILVYVDDGKGGLDLGAVEYFRADADQDLGTDEDRPTLFGEPFDGPMEGHEPGMPVHYDLHVWLYEKNPAGELAAWNPDVTCS